MLQPIAFAGGLAALLALGACGSSGGDSAADTREFAGLWDAGTTLEDGTPDERYVAISTDGRYTEYDYRQDGAASDGNCYLVTAQRLGPIESDDVPIEPSFPLEADPFDVDGFPATGAGFVTDSTRAYRLDDGRTVRFFVVYGFDSGFDPNGSLTDDDVLGEEGSAAPSALIPVFDEVESIPSDLYWPIVEGLSTEDLVPCEQI